MYSTLGWINVAIISIITAPYWMMLLNRKIFHFKGESYFKVIKYVRKIHKPLGIAILVIGLIHGYLALGSIRIHTGSLLWVTMLLTATLGGAFYRTKKKGLFKLHKFMAFLTVALLLLHLIKPSALYGLF